MRSTMALRHRPRSARPARNSKSTCSPKTLSGAGSFRPTEATGSRVAVAGSRLARAVRLAQQQPSKLARAAQTHLEGPLVELLTAEVLLEAAERLLDELAECHALPPCSPCFGGDRRRFEAARGSGGSVARDRRRARVAPEERAVHHPASRQLSGEAAELVDTTNSDVHDAHAHAPLIAARLQPERLELRGLQLGFDRLHGERGAIAAGVPSHAGLENQETRGASAAGCGASARTGGRDTLRGTAMPRRGRPAQGHAPAEGLAQNDMAHLFVADAAHRTQALGATRMVVECWLIP